MSNHLKFGCLVENVFFVSDSFTIFSFNMANQSHLTQKLLDPPTFLTFRTESAAVHAWHQAVQRWNSWPRWPGRNPKKFLSGVVVSSTKKKGVSKNRGKTPQIMNVKIGFSMIFTIHVGGFPPIFWKHLPLFFGNTHIKIWLKTLCPF